MEASTTPRARCARYFTQSTNSATLSAVKRLGAWARASSQVELKVSHISEEMEPRTARAFSRAERRQLRMLDELPVSKAMKSMTQCGSIRS